MSATPHIPFLKTQITHHLTLIKQVNCRINRLKFSRPTTKRAQYIVHQQLTARRILRHDYYNHLHYYQNYLDFLSGC